MANRFAEIGESTHLIVKTATVTLRLLLVVFLIVSVAPPEASAQGAPASQRLRCVEVNATKTCVLYTASIIDLIANPDLFDGKRIRTFGYIHFEFEGNGIYLHHEDYARSLYANGLWVNLAQNVSRAECQDRYALVEGTFRARDRGHLGLWSGAIGEITRCMALR